MKRSVARTLVSVLAFAVVATLGIAGCDQGQGDQGKGGKGGETKTYKFAFVTNNTSDFWKIAAAGVRKYESEGKIQVDIRQPQTGKVEEQNQIIETLISQGYDAVAVSAVAPTDQVLPLNKAAEKTKLITFDSDAPKSKRLLYIGTNNYEAGKVLGQQIIKLLPNGGKMAVFVGSFSADNADQRFRGIQDAIKGTKIEIVDKREDNTDRAKARGNVESVINAHQDLNLVCGLWSYNGPQIAAAIDGSGKKGKVLAAVFDEEDGTLAGIQSGTIQVTVVQKPYQFGYLASKWMHELVTKPDAAKAAMPKDGILDTGVDVISKENVADFKAKLEALRK